MTDHVQYDEFCNRVGSGCSENLEMIFKPNTKPAGLGGGGQGGSSRGGEVSSGCNELRVWVGFGVRIREWVRGCTLGLVDWSQLLSRLLDWSKK